MAKLKSRIADKVKVVGMLPVKYLPGVKDELGTEKLFKRMRGKVIPFEGSTNMEMSSLNRNG